MPSKRTHVVRMFVCLFALLGSSPLRAEPAQALERAALRTLRHQAAAALVAFAPNGKTLAVADYDGNIHLWNLDTARKITVLSSPGTDKIRFYRQELGKQIQERKAQLKSNQLDKEQRQLLEDDVHNREQALRMALIWAQLLFSADGKVLMATECASTRLVRWDAASGKELPTWTVTGRIALAADGRLYACRDRQETVLSDAASGRALRRFRSGGPSDSGAFGFAFLPDGRLAAGGTFLVENANGAITVARNNRLALWDADTLHELYELERLPKAAEYAPVAAAKDGRLVLAHCRGTLVAWETETGRIVERWDNPILRPRTIEAAANLVLLVGEGGDVLLLDTMNGQRLVSWQGCSAALAADGKKLALADAEGLVRILDVEKLRTRVPAPALTEQALQDLWEKLAAEPAQAEQALRTLCRAGGQVEPFLSRRLSPVRRVDEPQLKQWIADLSSEEFKTRQRAAQGLAASDTQATAALTRALHDKPDLETRNRLANLLDNVTGPVRDAHLARSMRAVAILEQVGSQEARRILTTLADGADAARLTRKAKAALGRLR